MPLDIKLAEYSMLDFSSIDQFLGCGEQFRRVRIMGEKEKPSFAMDEGTGHHHALATNNISKRDKGKVLKPAVMVDLAAFKMKELAKKGVALSNKAKYFGEESVDDGIKRAKIWYPDYLRKFDPDIDPDWVEQPFIKEVEINDMKFKLSGVIDLTTKKKRKLRDYKSSKSVKSQAEADSSVQLSLYSATTGLTDVGYINFVKTANPYIAEIKSTRSPAQHAWAMMVAQRVLQSIRAGVFPLANPTPMNWRCSEKFCGFWPTCRGKYETLSQQKIKE